MSSFKIIPSAVGVAASPPVTPVEEMTGPQQGFAKPITLTSNLNTSTLVNSMPISLPDVMKGFALIMINIEPGLSIDADILEFQDSGKPIYFNFEDPIAFEIPAGTDIYSSITPLSISRKLSSIEQIKMKSMSEIEFFLDNTSMEHNCMLKINEGEWIEFAKVLWDKDLAADMPSVGTTFDVEISVDIGSPLINSFIDMLNRTYSKTGIPQSFKEYIKNIENSQLVTWEGIIQENIEQGKDKSLKKAYITAASGAAAGTLATAGLTAAGTGAATAATASGAATAASAAVATVVAPPLVAATLAAGVVGAGGIWVHNKLTQNKPNETDIEICKGLKKELFISQSNAYWAIKKNKFNEALNHIYKYQQVSKILSQPKWQQSLGYIFEEDMNNKKSEPQAGGGKYKQTRTKTKRCRTKRRRTKRCRTKRCRTKRCRTKRYRTKRRRTKRRTS
jgi:hypothetical protein